MKKEPSTTKRGEPLPEKSSLDHTWHPSSSLALFRIFFGCALTNHLWKLYYSDWIHQNYELATITLKYDLLPWLEATPSSLNLICLALLVCSILFTIGLAYRITSILLLLLYAYLFLLDPTWATPSRYLVLVVLALFALTNCHSKGSLDSLIFSRLKSPISPAPAFHLLSFKALFTIVLLYSGIAKWASEDWMERGEPLATWLFFGSVAQPFPLWSFLTGPSVGYTPSALITMSFLLSYTIVAVELLGTVCLWHRWTRFLLGIPSLLFLQLLYSNIAEGAYPLVIACSLSLWLPSSVTTYIIKVVGLESGGNRTREKRTTSRSKGSNPCSSIASVASKIRTILIYILLAQQAATPILPYVSNHPADWSTNGAAFGWRLFTHSQHTLVSWYAHKLPNPKTTVAQPSKSYLITHHTQDYSSMRSSADAWHASLNNPSLLLQWSQKAVLATMQRTGFNPSQLHINAYRSVNGRPYQRWFKPGTSDVVRANCSFSIPLACDHLLEPRIEEFNTLHWLLQQQAFEDEWALKGYESIVFAERKSATSFDAAFEPFAESLQLILLSGKITLETAYMSSTGALQPFVGERVPIPWTRFHSIRVLGAQPAAWAYIWPGPRNMTLSDAMGM